MPDEERRREPQRTRLRSLSPMFTVSDLDASIAWYRDVLGFHLADEWTTPDGNRIGASLRAGSVDLLLNQDDFSKGTDRPKGVGFRLYCVTAQDLDALAEAIRTDSPSPSRRRSWSVSGGEASCRTHLPPSPAFRPALHRERAVGSAWSAA